MVGMREERKADRESRLVVAKEKDLGEGRSGRLG